MKCQKTSFNKKTVHLCISALLVFLLFSCSDEPRNISLKSPNDAIELKFDLSNEGELLYSAELEGQEVIRSSKLGLNLESGGFTSDLSIQEISEVETITDNYEMVQGKQRDILYEANEQTISLQNNKGDELNIIFRVSNDGVAFKYQIPNSSNKSIRVTEEITSFSFGPDDQMWVQPMSVPKSGWRRTNPSYEEEYYQGVSINTESPLKFGWVFPSLFKVKDNWVLISEAGLESNYSASRLSTSENSYTVSLQFPPEEESIMGGDHLPNSAGPLSSPWRIITMGSLETIVESTMGTDLAKPAIPVAERSKPGYASWSWALLKDSSVVYDIQKKFIDYAADMNWQYCLVDVNWDENIGYERIEELAQYAISKNVGLLLWYNSSGDWNDTDYSPKSALITHEQRVSEFNKIRELGVKGVKIDFFGGDGQSVIAYYEDILEDAADAGLLVNFHGATLPRGWHRTYHNLMTVEAVKGFEFITFSQEVADKAPEHCATLPFTRNVFDPMDFTPMAFSGIPNIDKRTTNGFELALPTLFTSGIQHLAEVPEGIEAMPEFVRDYLSDLPTSWDQTEFVQGFPGAEVVIGRRSGNEWYISGVNGEEKAKTLNLNLDFLKGYSGIIIKDNANVNSLVMNEMTIVQDSNLNVSLPAYGGFVIKLVQN